MQHPQLHAHRLALFLSIFPATVALSACSDEASPQDTTESSSGGTSSSGDGSGAGSEGEQGSKGGMSGLGGSSASGGDTSAMAGGSGTGAAAGAGGSGTGGVGEETKTCTGVPMETCFDFYHPADSTICEDVPGCSSEPSETCFELPAPDCWAEYKTQNSCNRSALCWWVEDAHLYCSDIDPSSGADCFVKYSDEYECTGDPECKWGDDPYCGWAQRGSCAKPDIQGCLDTPGCEWGRPCLGTPTRTCEDQASERGCASVEGCSWQ